LGMSRRKLGIGSELVSAAPIFSQLMNKEAG
jgi:hypothetical protein